MPDCPKMLVPLALSGLLVLGCRSTEPWTPVQESEPVQDVFGGGDYQPVDGPEEPTLEQCDNGLDDDWDGLVDCVDPECVGQEACPPEGDLREAMELRIVFWSTYVAGDSVVYQSAGELSGELWIQRRMAEASEWSVVCSSLLSLTGTPTQHPDSDLAFDLSIEAAWSSDGCALGTDRPPLPQVLGWNKGDEAARLFFADSPEAQSWPLLSGAVGWDHFESQDDFFVMTPGEVVVGLVP